MNLSLGIYIAIIVFLITIYIIFFILVIDVIKELRRLELDLLNIKKAQRQLAAYIDSAKRELSRLEQEVEVLDCSDINN